MLSAVWMKVLTMAVTALPVMAVVLAVRWLLRQAPKKYTYLLWLIVAFRLVCPVAPESPVGLIRASETQRQIDSAEEIYIEPTLTYRDNGGFTPDYDVLLNRGYTPNEQGEIVTNGAGTREALQVKDLLAAAAMVWLLGVVAMAGYLLYSTLRLRRQLATAVRWSDNVWECDGIPTPFVLGVFRPRIYLPFRVAEAERTYILAHERCHIRWGDHLAKPAALMILTVYWWNPAVWLCWVLFCRDMEMRCDETVLAKLGDGIRQEYSRSLISFALDRRAPMALAFGEHDAAKRVKHVLKWKKAAPGMIFLAISVLIVAAMVCGTNAENTSWVKAEKKPAENGAVQFTWNLEETVAAWALYEDVYEGGQLIASTARVMDTFREDGGVSDRRETISLWVNVVNAENGFGGVLECSFGGIGQVQWSVTMPKDRYTGAGYVLMDDYQTPDAKIHRRQTLECGESVVLLTALLSTKETGGTTFYSADEGGIYTANDTVVQFRLVTAGGTLDSFVNDGGVYTVSTEIKALMDAAKTVDPYRLTERLMAENLWNDAITQPAQVTAVANFDITVVFRSAPENPEALDAAMARRAVVLSRLVPEAVNRLCWSYPGEAGTEHREFHWNETAAVIALSSDLRTYLPVQTAVDLERLIRFLSLDEKVFVGLAEPGDLFSPLYDAQEAAVWFTPEDIHDLEYIELVREDGQRASPRTGEDYEFVEEKLRAAGEIASAEGTYDGTVLYLHRSDGVTGKLLPAAEPWGVFRSGDAYYRYGGEDAAETFRAAFELH